MPILRTNPQIPHYKKGMEQLDQLLQRIVSMSKVESMDLEKRGRAGDLEALKVWVLYTAWEKIEQDRTIEQKAKVRLFRHILQLVRLSVEVTKEDLTTYKPFDPEELKIRIMSEDAGAAPAADGPPAHVHDPITVAGTVICKLCGVQNFG